MVPKLNKWKHTECLSLVEKVKARVYSPRNRIFFYLKLSPCKRLQSSLADNLKMRLIFLQCLLHLMTCLIP
jgi:hypothetical protein